MTISVLKPGLQSTLQSRPRIGLRHQGVPANGAADPLSLALANKLVGNAWDAPAVEAALLGPKLRFDNNHAFALTGATAVATLNGSAIAQHETVFAKAGDELAIGATEVGSRVYLAIAGGFIADEILGSSSTNLQAAFGGLQGRALRAGDALHVADGDADALQTPAEFRLPMSSSACETALLNASSLAALFETNWIIDRRADRMGLRLEGPRLAVASEGRMPSAGVIPGTIQCPEDGAPYVLSVDAGTVGGYPRVAQVARVDRHVLGQLRPGDHVRLLRREPDEAARELRGKINYWREWLPQIGSILR
jgi:allophanate hydrolase